MANWRNDGKERKVTKTNINIINKEINSNIKENSDYDVKRARTSASIQINKNIKIEVKQTL